MTNNNVDDLSRFLAEKITSPFNQHYMLRFVASAGMGKSLSAIGLCVGVAEEVARIKGGCAEDYFLLSRDMACMSSDEISRVLSDPGQFHILLLDDVGIGVGARDFQKNSNKELSKIIQTFRPKNNLVVETLQAGFLVDKIFRLLAHMEIEIESTNFPYGYVVGKCQEIVYKHKTEKIHYPYIVMDGKRYVRHIFQAPKPEIIQQYELERAKQLKRIMEKEQEQENTEPIKISITDDIIKLNGEFLQGKFKDMYWKDVVISHGYNVDSANVILSKHRRS